MDKHRLWRETKAQATLIVKTKLLFVEKGDELRQCLTEFYLELVRDIELIKNLHVERDAAIFRYVLDKQKNERTAHAVQL